MKLNSIILIIIFTIIFNPQIIFSLEEDETLRREYRKKIDTSVHELLEYSDFTAEFALNDEDEDNYLRISNNKNFSRKKIRKIYQYNSEFFKVFRKKFANFDSDFNFINYKRINITGKFNWSELKTILGLIILVCRTMEEDNNPVEAMKLYLGLINLMNSDLTLKGVQGVTLKYMVVKKLLPAFENHFSKFTYSDSIIMKLKNYFQYYSQISFDMKEMYERERVFVLGKVLPLFKDEIERRVSFEQKIEDVIDGVSSQSDFWKYKDVESYILQYYRLTKLPVEKKVRQFKKMDKSKSKNRMANTYLKYQLPVLMKVMHGQAILNIISQYFECEVYRRINNKWPENEKNLKQSNLYEYQDPFHNRSSLKIIGKKNIIIIYSNGRNFLDNIFKGDDIVLKVAK